MRWVFPNPSRSFVASRSCVLFSGYDRTIEMSFFVGTDDLKQLCPEMVAVCWRGIAPIPTNTPFRQIVCQGV
jgi:hypothetical protein